MQANRITLSNLSVAWTVRNGFTRSTEGMRMLQERWHPLHAVTVVVIVISADNPADEPSRGKKVESERIVRMKMAIEAQDRGEMTASAAWKPELWKGDSHLVHQIRHEMCGSDEEEGAKKNGVDDY